MTRHVLTAEWIATHPSAFGRRWVSEETVPVHLLGTARALLAAATHAWIDDPEPFALDLDALLVRARSFRDQTFALFAGDPDAPDLLLHIALSRTGPTLCLELGPPWTTLDARPPLDAMLRAWTTALLGSGCRLVAAHITSDHPYERPRPPREHRRIVLGALDCFLGRAANASEAAFAPELAALEGAALPVGVTRTVDGDLLHLGFVADPTDDASIAAARRRSEDWLAEVLAAEPAPGWNERGDPVAVVIDRDPLEPFTFFDACEGIGYKALVLDPDDHSLDEAMWAALVRIAASGATDEGTAVGAVRVVVPVREDAARLHRRARDAGLAVVYPEGDRFFLYDGADRD